MAHVTLGEMIRYCREGRGISRRSLSLRAGLSESVVGKVESSRMQPSLRVFGQLAMALGLNDHEIALLVRLNMRSLSEQRHEASGT